MDRSRLDLTLPADGQYVAFADFVPKGKLEPSCGRVLAHWAKDMLHEPTLTPDTLTQRVGDLE